MGQIYWLRREREEMAHASLATSDEARLIHSDLAQRYGVKAADVETSPPSLSSDKEHQYRSKKWHGSPHGAVSATKGTADPKEWS